MKFSKLLILSIFTFLTVSCGSPYEDEVFRGSAVDGYCDYFTDDFEHSICKMRTNKIAGNGGTVFLSINKSTFSAGRLGFCFNLTKDSSDGTYDFSSCEIYPDETTNTPHLKIKNYKNAFGRNDNQFEEFICACGNEITASECQKCGAVVSVLYDVPIQNPETYVENGKYTFAVKSVMKPASANNYSATEEVYDVYLTHPENISDSQIVPVYSVKAEDCMMIKQNSMKPTYLGIYFWIKEKMKFDASWKMPDLKA